MQLKYLKTITESQNDEYPIAAIAFSSNNKKIAVGTCERVILLFDENGNRRDKFNTKPSDPSAGKKSYSITCLAFNNESELLAVGQSDSIVFVYRIGAGWDSKKVICNKFPINSFCSCVIWVTPATLLAGSTDGKLRSLDCKTNKSANSWSGNTACISLSSFGGSIVSGHIDGALLSAGGQLLAKHPVPPTAMCLLENAILVAGCDRRIVIYDSSGKPLNTFDYSKQHDQREFTVAATSMNGQIAMVGSYDKCHLIEWSTTQGRWLSKTVLKIKGLYTVRSIAWSADGSLLAVGGFTGATLIYEAMTKRWLCGNSVEAIRRGQGQITLKKLSEDIQPLTVQTSFGRNINSVKLMGGEWYAVCRTESSLILCDLTRALTSEIPWVQSGERFFFQHAPVCLIYHAGELTLVEYGIDSILGTVRTEFVSPYLISVRINEDGDETQNNKKIAYLLDHKHVCILDLETGIQVMQAKMDSKIDWLELNESARILLLRDRRRQLIMIDTVSGKKEIILSNVNYVQWVEDSDAVVAQTSSHVAVWYSITDVNSIELYECGGGIVTRVERVKNVPRVILENGSIPHIVLEDAKLKFNASLRVNDLEGCKTYLNSLGDSQQIKVLWQQLADRAMERTDLKLAISCYEGLGDDAYVSYLKHTLSIAEKHEQEFNEDGLKSPHARARLAVLKYDLKTAENIYLNEMKSPPKAISMYKTLYRWKDAINLAERLGLSELSSLREEYMSHLIARGDEGEASSLLVSQGDIRGGLRLVLQAGLPGRAARLLREYPTLLSDRDCYMSVLQSLLKNESWEQAAELCETAGEMHQAIDLYAKANSYAKAVHRARQMEPERVTSLELQWGEWLVSSRQWGAAVSHLIEAGDSKAAVAAAIKAQQWTKALQIIQVIDDTDSIQEYFVMLADHFAAIEDWNTAEALWEAGNLVDQGARVLGNAGQWGRALAFVRRTLGSNAASAIFQPEAENLKEKGLYKEAENLYVGLGLTDAAIAMYEAAGKYTSLLRLVSKHRPQLLGAARRRVAQALRDEGRYKQAEQHYIEADDWKGAIQMYRAVNQWEEAYRIAQQYAPPQIQEQVIVAWSNSLEDDSAAAKILSSHGALEAGIRWAARGGRWSRALSLCQIGAPQLEGPVRAQMAAQLEDEGKLEEAEGEFIKGGGAIEAIDMWLHAQQYARALTLAEQHAPEKESEVLQAYAEWAEAQGDLPLYEALIIRAGRPQDIIKYYKDNFMWEDAIRVCEEYLPQGVHSLREEAAQASGLKMGNNSNGFGNFNALSDADPETLLRSAVEYSNKGEYWEAVQALLSVSVESAGAGTVERAALRAARLVRDHLSSHQARQIAPLISQRLNEAGQSAMGARVRDALMSMSSNVDNVEDTNGDESNKAEQLARRGEWLLALEAASTLGSSATSRLAVKWAGVLLQQPDTTNYQNPDGTYNGGVAAALAVLIRWGVNTSSAINLAAPLLARASALANPSFNLLRDLRNVLHSIMVNMSNETPVPRELERMVEASALLCVRETCRTVPALKPLSLRASVAVLRYTDIIAADNAFYEAGNLMKESGREGEALVFLNRYLDLAEASDVDIQDNATFDHTDFENTDFPHEIVLGGTTLSAQQHDEIREWVLAISLDQNISQVLPLDKRNLYECCLGPGDIACVLTGYPLAARIVHFTNGRAANRDAWTKLLLHCNTDPTGDPADCRRFITMWCGADDYNLN